MNNADRIRRIIAYYRRIFATSDPFEIADRLGVLYQFGNCKFAGCYMFLKNHRYIFLSNELQDPERKLVMAHELGHAVLDRKENCYFIRNKTLLSISKFERRANLFAAYLLITDDMLMDYKGYTQEYFCKCTGHPKELLELRLKDYAP